MRCADALFCNEVSHEVYSAEMPQGPLLVNDHLDVHPFSEERLELFGDS